jgi:integrase
LDLVSAPEAKQRRTYGSGSLLVHTGADGQEVWYGRWYVGKKHLSRRIGPKRRRGTGKGLTQTEADAELRRMMLSERAPRRGSTLPLAAAAEQMLRHLEANGRAPTTIGNYRAILHAHLLPRFGETELDSLRQDQVEAFATDLLRKGLSARTRASALKLLSQILTFAQRRGWCQENVCALVPRPRVRPSTDIRFLDRMELAAFLGAIDISAEPFGRIDRALFLTAAMTGMRQGELLALRWRDVDWEAKRVRVRRNYVRGDIGKPKSKSGERSVPMASRVVNEMRSLRGHSSFLKDDDLVFAHPETGSFLPLSPMRQRFKSALKAAGVRDIRFHDLRHTFGTRMAASPNVSMRDLQEWLGHRDYRTTLIYADYEPRDGESDLVDEAFS